LLPTLAVGDSVGLALLALRLDRLGVDLLFVTDSVDPDAFFSSLIEVFGGFLKFSLESPLEEFTLPDVFRVATSKLCLRMIKLHANGIPSPSRANETPASRIPGVCSEAR